MAEILGEISVVCEDRFPEQKRSSQNSGNTRSTLRAGVWEERTGNNQSTLRVGVWDIT